MEDAFLLAAAEVKVNPKGVTPDSMFSCVSVSGRRRAEMAQVKVAGDAGRSQQDYTEVYSDMATVSSSAGESRRNHVQLPSTDSTFDPFGDLSSLMHLIETELLSSASSDFSCSHVKLDIIRNTFMPPSSQVSQHLIVLLLSVKQHWFPTSESPVN